MTTRMVRKQIYIQKRQDILLKRLSQTRGLSEAEIIRQAIESQLAGDTFQPIVADHEAWQELTAFLEKRQSTAGAGQPYRWNRQELYAEREDRWLNEQKQD